MPSSNDITDYLQPLSRSANRLIAPVLEWQCGSSKRCEATSPVQVIGSGALRNNDSISLCTGMQASYSRLHDGSRTS